MLRRYASHWLDASIGANVRKICSEKIVIEVDPVRNTKGSKDIDKSTELLKHWCNEFWKSVYNARSECPM